MPHFKRYDADLNYIAPDIVANAFAHTNTASIGLIRDMIYIVAPSTPIQGGQVRTQRNLLLLRFDKTTWAAKDSTAITLVDSNSMTHANDGDGIWMSTGLTYDTGNACMFVGHTFSNGAGGSDGGDIYLRVFDGNTLTQTYSEVMVSSTSANRVHFLLGDNTLYAVYDENAVIKALKYTLTYAKTSKLTGSDFNNDGKTDVLLQNSQTGMVYIWLVDGAGGIKSGGSPGTVDPEWQIQGAGDFNGDGKGDILWRNTTSGVVYVWLMDDTSVSGGTPLATIDDTWQIY
ncbi:FG-GAP repeat domain-containing protein [Candidatus Magnetobacterium casense]|uniref:VCBS repeat-containing protein n=1 Tax=Candidatus Magnetobacterium casense TaxID=1455061 RepID=A0ABS6RW67_9BACT|nr:VCBS repeat-containing protein [Candidatus Magnetobacterium casensis]MBV6340866.1 VCBS repeat-containing protein [Candidatus Magnetobacterium casensis]